MSQARLPDEAAVVFDLDDTLYYERDFAQSGHAAVALWLKQHDDSGASEYLLELVHNRVDDPYGKTLRAFSLPVDKASMLRVYREHIPNISLESNTRRLLEEWASRGRRMGLLTDGRSITQRNKIKALKIEECFDAIVISEEFGSGKPDERNYRCFEALMPASSYIYVGDNLSKDFVTPNRIGWGSIAVRDRGFNIHPQHPESTPPAYLPDFFVQQVA